MSERLTTLEKRLLTLAQGPDPTWVAPAADDRTVDDQRIVRVIDSLYARGLLRLTRCGPDGEDNRYRLTEAGRQALLKSRPA